MIVRVATEIALNKFFDYEVPPQMERLISIGSRVKIPFGHREVLGYVTEVIEKTTLTAPSGEGMLPGTEVPVKLKRIIKVIGEQNLITPKVMALAVWMAGYYCCSVEVALRSLLPKMVCREQEGWKKQLYVRYNQGVPEPDKLTKRQKEVLDFIQQKRELPLTQLTTEMGCTSDIVRRLEKTGKVTLAPLKVLRDPYANLELIPTQPRKLNPAQETALRQIVSAMDAKDRGQVKPFLLFGVTGSGKTEVYLQAIAHALEKGQGAIVLVPEISLTPQTVERFKARFAEGPLRTQVAVLHSHLSDGERHDEWHKIRKGNARIVIGARSAVFAPVDPLGVIIVDEEHEYSYKQESEPRYNARDVAVVRAQKEDTIVVLGSATPSMESYYNAQKGKYTLLTLPHRVDNIKMPGVRIVNMSSEMRMEGVPQFSTMLKEAIRLRLDEHQQVILFLNRRGYATQLQCPACGYVAYCPYCSVALTYHRRECLLKCHICGYQVKAPYNCPECNEPGIRYKGTGTERVEETLAKLFPSARIRRMDTDTLKKKDDYQKILRDFGLGKIDILLGTQMITKGLHFPRVTLVGIINADISLHRPDFRASERTFQLITQVAGRAGRGNEEGEVIVQTFTPWAPAISYARDHDYVSFYEEEIQHRAELSYPPFGRLVLITILSPNEELLQRVAEELRRQIETRVPAEALHSLKGPVPALLERAEGYYRYHIQIQTRKMSVLSRHLFDICQEFRCPEEVNFTVDVDPVNMV